MINEERLEKSLQYLAETDEKHAEVTANVKYLERQLKRIKALFITADTTLKSISAKEQLYYASEDYNKAIRELYDAEVGATTLENQEIAKRLHSR